MSAGSQQVPDRTIYTEQLVLFIGEDVNYSTARNSLTKKNIRHHLLASFELSFEYAFVSKKYISSGHSLNVLMTVTGLLCWWKESLSLAK